MKYANQINLALAALGVVVVLYALSITFLSPSPSATLNIDQLVQEGSRRVVARPLGTDVSPILRTSTTSARGAVVGAPGGSSSGLIGAPGGSAQVAPSRTARPSPGRSRTLPSSRAVRIGNAPDTSPGSRAPAASPESVTDDELTPYDQARPAVNRQRPPAGAESAKRGASDSDTPTPPTRSSMPIQQRRP